VSLSAVAAAVGDLEEVHFVMFGLPTFNAFVAEATRQFGEPVDDEYEEEEGISTQGDGGESDGAAAEEEAGREEGGPLGPDAQRQSEL
jgi:hypothetical protein